MSKINDLIKELCPSGVEYKTIKDITNVLRGKRLTTKEVLNYYQAAHCFHIFNKELFKEDGYMLKEDLCLLEIPVEETIDIDTKEDYEYAKWKYEKNNI